MSTPYGAPMPTSGPTCPRHPDRVTYVTCQRCGRPTCPECQVPAAVGVHCVDCATQARRERPAAVRRAQAMSDPPYVTYALTGLICLVYVVQLIVPPTTTALAMIPQLAWQEPWRFVTSALVHDPGFPLHLIGNAFLLVLLGRVVEPAMGHLRYAAMCLFSAIGGSVAVLWMAAPPTNVVSGSLAWFTPVIGFSTVGYGLMCALLVMEMRRRGDVRGVAVLLALNVGFSLMVARVSWQGHLGGAMAGLAVTWALMAGRRSPRQAGLVAGVALGTLVAAVVGRYALVAPYWGGFGG